MKKAIVLGAAMLLVGATAFAADVKFGGAFKAGYNFQYYTDADKWVNSEKTDGDNKAEAEMDLDVADADGLWAVSFGADPIVDEEMRGGFGDYYMKAKLTVDFTKALAAGGVDLGDFTLKASIGNQDTENMASAYGNYSGRNYQQLKATSLKKNSSSTLTSVDLGYGKMVSAQYKFDPTGELHQGVGAVVTPVDGVKVSATYVQKGVGKRFFTTQGKTNWVVQGAADVDINKFVNVDKLTLKAGAFYDFVNADYTTDKDGNLSLVGAGAKVGYDKYSLGVDYVFEQKFKGTTSDKTKNVNHLMAKATIKDLVKGLTLAPWYRDDDFDTDGCLVGLETSYTFAKVTYHVDLEGQFGTKDTGKIKTGKNEDYVKIMPYVTLSF